MLKKIVVWRESVYKNEFRCLCGAFLADVDGSHYEDNVFAEKLGFRTYLHCKECLKPVAYLETADLPEDMEGKQGNINDYYERRKKN